MPAPYGLVTTGFSAPTFAELRDTVNRRILDTISPTLDLSDHSFEGQLIAIVLEQVMLVWEGYEEATGFLDPDKAVDAVLDAICLITGTFRRGAYASTVALTLTGDDAAPIPAGNIARVPSGPKFTTQLEVTLEALDAWVGLTSYAVDDRVTNAGNCYLCITAGISANPGGPETTDPDIVDNTVHWRFLGAGVAAADVAATATETGPLAANSGTVTEIMTPVGGWSGVINILDATTGALQMSNEDLRKLRVTELARRGSGTIDAIEADFLDPGKVPNVIAVTVFNNTSDATVDGMSPHSIELLIMGGDDQAIWNQLHKSVGGGIATNGTEVGTATDRRGREHTYRFNRPTEIPIYIALTVTRDPDSAPEDLEDQIKNAIVAWGDAQTNGKDAVASRIGAESFVDDSVLDVEAFIGIAPAPGTSVTVDIDIRELATYDTSRIDITFVDGEP